MQLTIHIHEKPTTSLPAGVTINSNADNTHTLTIKPSEGVGAHKFNNGTLYVMPVWPDYEASNVDGRYPPEDYVIAFDYLIKPSHTCNRSARYTPNTTPTTCTMD